MLTFVLFAIAGLVAQLVDGSLGMAYGVTSTTLLLAGGLAPAAASATVHLAEIGTTLVSGAAHWRFGNVDWRTISWMALPGALGAFLGAILLSSLPVEGSTPWIAGLLIALGLYVLFRFTRRVPVRNTRRIRSAFLVPLGLVAGAMDAVGGGGWGPIGTSTLLASGRLEPRKVVGSVDTAEFAVTIGGSAGFLLALTTADIHLVQAAALLAGGLVAAPLAAWLVRVMPTRVLGAGAGGLIVLTNARTLMETVAAPAPWPAVTYTVIIASWACALLVAVRLTRGRTAWPQPR